MDAAKRAIQTFKNRLISGFCCTASEWSLQLWNNLTKQALVTFNLCRTSRKEPKKSAYHSFYGNRYDWNKHPMAPPGTRAVVYEAPVRRLSWGTRGVDGWYCGPAFDHYRNMRFYILETRAYRNSASYMIFSATLPIANTDRTTQHNKEVAQEWIESIQRLKNKPKKPLSKS